jgi:hypothetical protein
MQMMMSWGVRPSLPAWSCMLGPLVGGLGEDSVARHDPQGRRRTWSNRMYTTVRPLLQVRLSTLLLPSRRLFAHTFAAKHVVLDLAGRCQDANTLERTSVVAQQRVPHHLLIRLVAGGDRQSSSGCLVVFAAE